MKDNKNFIKDHKDSIEIKRAWIDSIEGKINLVVKFYNDDDLSKQEANALKDLAFNCHTRGVTNIIGELEKEIDSVEKEIFIHKEEISKAESEKDSSIIDKEPSSDKGSDSKLKDKESSDQNNDKKPPKSNLDDFADTSTEMPDYFGGDD